MNFIKTMQSNKNVIVNLTIGLAAVVGCVILTSRYMKIMEIKVDNASNYSTDWLNKDLEINQEYD